MFELITAQPTRLTNLQLGTEHSTAESGEPVKCGVPLGALLSASVLSGLNCALAHLSVHLNAAGALLSPSSALDLEAVATAGAFLLARLGFLFMVAYSATSLALWALRERG